MAGTCADPEKMRLMNKVMLRLILDKVGIFEKCLLKLKEAGLIKDDNKETQETDGRLSLNP
jgi:hypothetical protein